MECKICGNELNNKPFLLREYGMGLLDEFEYFRCSSCGCLQITELPENIEKYYNSEKYYSYNQIQKIQKLKAWTRWKFWHILDYAFWKSGKIGALLSLKYTKDYEWPFAHHRWITQIQWKSDWSILDVGCGDGLLLYLMKKHGFQNLQGADPFIEKDFEVNGIPIQKKSMSEIPGMYDVVMMHHSLEHIFGQQEAARNLARLLKEEGFAIVRLPLFSEYLFKLYGEYVLSLDPPRHFFLHTFKSLSILFNEVNLEIVQILQDPKLENLFLSAIRKTQYGGGKYDWEECVASYRKMVDSFQTDDFTFIVRKKSID